MAIERAWGATPRVAEDPDMIRLRERVADVADEHDTLLAARWYDSVEERRARLRQMVRSLRAKVDSDEEERLDTILRMAPGSGLWRYGDGRDGGLELPSDDTDRLVLSGVAGEELLRADETLRRVRVGRSLFETAILLGSLHATLLSEQADDGGSSVSYRGREADGLVAETRIGGSMHGDFVLSRRTHFTAPVIDPTGQPREIAPVPRDEVVYGYHSIEDEVLAALLWRHASDHSDEELHALHARIARRAPQAQEGRGAMLYADFGDRGGHIMPGELQDQLANRRQIEPDQVLARILVSPYSDQELLLVAKPEGVLFCNTASGVDEATRSLLIPTEEIEDFVVTLLRNGHGRTGAHSLIKVLDVIAPKTTTA